MEEIHCSQLTIKWLLIHFESHCHLRGSALMHCWQAGHSAVAVATSALMSDSPCYLVCVFVPIPATTAAPSHAHCVSSGVADGIWLTSNRRNHSIYLVVWCFFHGRCSLAVLFTLLSYSNSPSTCLCPQHPCP